MRRIEDMTPDEVCGEIQRQIRTRLSEHAENQSYVYANTGFYFIKLYRGKVHGSARYTEFTLRRKQLREWFRGLKK